MRRLDVPLPGPAGVLDLVCTGDLHLTVDAGPHRTGTLRCLLLGTHWWLHPEGRLLLVCAPGTDRDAGYPMAGCWSVDRGGLTLSAGSVAPDGATAGFEGRVTPGPDGHPYLDATHTTRAVTGSRVSRLRGRAAVAAPGSRDDADRSVGGVRVPAGYEVRLAGVTAGTAFGPLPGQLTLLPAQEGATDPVEIRLDTDPTPRPVVGGLSWLVPAAGLTRQDTGRYTLELRDGTLTCDLRGEDTAGAVTWSAPPPPSPFTLPLRALPVPSTSARLTLDLRGDAVRGRIVAAGRLFESVVGYRAVIDGTPLARDLPEPNGAFDDWWRAASGVRPVAPTGTTGCRPRPA